MHAKWYVGILVILGGVPAFGQFSGSVSADLGAHQNPLYNYEMLSDQVHQAMVDLQYLSEGPRSQIGIRYLGALMLFNRFEERNYLEHALSARFTTVFGSLPPARQAAEEEEEEESEVPPGVLPDSSLSSLVVAVKGSARYDKAAFETYDNSGLELMGAYRFPVWQGGFIRLINQAGYRSYPNLTVLSNLMDLFTFQLGARLGNQTEIGGRASAGLKHFTTASYDTSLIDAQSTQSAGHGKKGKGGGQVAGGKQKKILANATASDSYHAALGLYAVRLWPTGSLRVELLYTFTPGSGGRYLAQYAQSSVLSSDIYNDYFSYAGPSLGVTVSQSVVYGIQTTLGVEWGRRQFVAPALDLDGNVIAGQRKDTRSGFDLSLSKYFELGGALGLDMTLSGSLLRNRSNDDYNDYSASGISLSLGLGF